MNLTTPDDRVDEKQDYLKELRRELAVLPPALRHDIVRDVTEHVEDAVEDSRSFSTSLGAPSAIARAGLEQRDLKAGRTTRPHISMLSKRLQLIVAIVYCPLAAFGIAGVVVAGVGPSFLLQLAPLLVATLLSLFARWTWWWRISLISTVAYAAYFSVALMFVIVFIAAPWPASFPAIVIPFIVSWPTMAVTHGPALVLLLIALVRAPAVLRNKLPTTGRDNSIS